MFRRWRLPKVYLCEVCGRDLNRRQVVELVDISRDGPSEFSGVIATYCTKHAPKGGA